MFGRKAARVYSLPVSRIYRLLAEEQLLLLLSRFLLFFLIRVTQGCTGLNTIPY